MPLLNRKDSKNSTKHRFGMNHLRRLFSTLYKPVMQEQQQQITSEEAVNLLRSHALAALEGRAEPAASSGEWYDWLDQTHEEEEQQPQGSESLRACLSPSRLNEPLPPLPLHIPAKPKDNTTNNNNNDGYSSNCRYYAQRPLPPTPPAPPVPPKDNNSSNGPRHYYGRPLPPTPSPPPVPPKDYHPGFPTASRRPTKPLPPLPLSYTERPLPPTPPRPQVPPKDFF